MPHMLWHHMLWYGMVHHMLWHGMPHHTQGIDPDDPKVGGAESLAATRCSSTRFAVTASYCGLEVPDPTPNPDH